MPYNPSLGKEEILTQLEQGPGRIAKLTAKLDPAKAKTPPAKDEWSANEVLAHLRACEEVWGSAILKLIATDKPTLRMVSPRTRMKKTDYTEQEFQSSLRAWIEQRTGLLQELNQLDLKDWSRTGIVIKDGKARERSVLSFAEQLVNHEGPHVEQIEYIVKAMSE